MNQVELSVSKVQSAQLIDIRTGEVIAELNMPTENEKELYVTGGKGKRSYKAIGEKN